jgi:hypothetical protein
MRKFYERAKKYGELLTAVKMIRFTPAQKELIESVGSADAWRDWMIEYATELVNKNEMMK